VKGAHGYSGGEGGRSVVSSRGASSGGGRRGGREKMTPFWPDMNFLNRQ
jgi:hypothetical protein